LARQAGLVFVDVLHNWMSVTHRYQGEFRTVKLLEMDRYHEGGFRDDR